MRPLPAAAASRNWDSRLTLLLSKGYTFTWKVKQSKDDILLYSISNVNPNTSIFGDFRRKILKDASNGCYLNKVLIL